MKAKLWFVGFGIVILVIFLLILTSVLVEGQPVAYRPDLVETYGGMIWMADSQEHVSNGTTNYLAPVSRAQWKEINAARKLLPCGISDYDPVRTNSAHNRSYYYDALRLTYRELGAVWNSIGPTVKNVPGGGVDVIYRPDGILPYDLYASHKIGVKDYLKLDCDYRRVTDPIVRVGLERLARFVEVDKLQRENAKSPQVPQVPQVPKYPYGTISPKSPAPFRGRTLGLESTELGPKMNQRQALPVLRAGLPFSTDATDAYRIACPNLRSDQRVVPLRKRP